MTNKSQQKPVREIIKVFFSELKNLEAMNDRVASVIQDLWKNSNLRRDELLSELKKIRDEDGSDE